MNLGIICSCSFFRLPQRLQEHFAKIKKEIFVIGIQRSLLNTQDFNDANKLKSLYHLKYLNTFYKHKLYCVLCQ